MINNKKIVCPYCNQEMKKWRVPQGSTWHNNFLYVCLNDNCPYFVEGWDYMWETQKVHASYRCRFDPDSGKYAPLPVWSPEALKNNIIE